MNDSSHLADDLPVPFGPLRDQLLGAASAFAGDSTGLAAILGGLVDDVERALREPLEIFPVCHHSPSSALHLVKRLRQRAPRVLFMECCEDLRPLIEGLRDCRLPVALQAFASTSDTFPAPWFPLNLVCPLTEFSAEFQAIAFALENPETELVFVDRSADHVFQWMPQDAGAVDRAIPADPDPDDEDAGMHGSAVGVEIGSLKPTFGVFREVLLKNARVQHFSEWWDQYVEEAVIHEDYSAYRQVMFLIGSLFRRLGTTEPDRRSDEDRERYMWTRMKQHLRASSVAPEDALYICGAAHAASRVAEFGTATDTVWEIPPPTATPWLYGLLPSSYGAICHQFGHPRGALTLAEARWRKALSTQSLRPFDIKPRKGKTPSTKVTKPVEAPVSTLAAASPDHLIGYLQKPPPPVASDEEELIHDCVRIVAMARKHGYLASTADGIATYQTAILLANLRNRRFPTPYDFRDAAVTCLEKDAVPGKRNVARLCDILLGGDKIGQIGFDSLPPLARDVLQRLNPLPVALESRTIQRALIDFSKTPELRPCSDLLWKLHYLLPGHLARPIMGQRQLGFVPRQESWDVAIAKNQGEIIQLGYEGVTVEHVMERRLKKVAFGAEARTSDAIRVTEDSLLFLQSDRLTAELGERAIDLLVREPDATQARQIHGRITRLVHHYRTTASGLPGWLERFVATGYSHYATLLPNAFGDRGTNPSDLAAMLQFVFTLESLALSLGCERSQLVIAIRQAATVTEDPPKLALLWSAECVLCLRDLSTLRSRIDDLTENELTLPSLPGYLEGLLLALVFTPLVGRLAVELMSKAFEKLPDSQLMPWMPKLLRMLRSHADAALPILVKEAMSLFPRDLKSLANWNAPWNPPETGADGGLQPSLLIPGKSGVLPLSASPATTLLLAHPATTDALAIALGLAATWTHAEPEPVLSPSHAEARALLQAFPSTLNAALAQWKE